jgi:nucleoside-diphosphate-sugar epimerase
VLVTGSSGHLGANLVRRLLADGQDLQVLLRAAAWRSGVDGYRWSASTATCRDAGAVHRQRWPAASEKVYHTAPGLDALWRCQAAAVDLLPASSAPATSLDACLQSGINTVVTGGFQRRWLTMIAIAAEHRRHALFTPSSA